MTRFNFYIEHDHQALLAEEGVELAGMAHVWAHLAHMVAHRLPADVRVRVTDEDGGIHIFGGLATVRGLYGGAAKLAA